MDLESVLSPEMIVGVFIEEVHAFAFNVINDASAMLKSNYEKPVLVNERPWKMCSEESFIAKIHLIRMTCHKNM